MEFFRTAPRPTSKLGILPGTFNPITIAHLALAQSALEHVDEVVFVLPRLLPHKTYSGASFDRRIEMLLAATAAESRWSVATSSGGLFLEIAAECRRLCGIDARLSFICGRDAAERIADWDYGRPGVYEEMVEAFDLLVAPRQGAGQHLGFRPLTLGIDYSAVSATEVRRRIAQGEPWEHLVPESVRRLAGEIYSTTGK